MDHFLPGLFIRSIYFKLVFFRFPKIIRHIKEIQLLQVWFFSDRWVTVDISNMCKTYLDTAELPTGRPKMWNKWICSTALISWIISRVSVNFNLAYHTKSTDLFRKTKFIQIDTNVHTHTFLHGSIWSKVIEERVRFRAVERRGQSVYIGLMEERRLGLHLRGIVVTDVLKRQWGPPCKWERSWNFREKGQ